MNKFGAVLAFFLIVSASFATVIGTSNAAYSKNLRVASTGNDYFDFNLRYDLTLQVETPSQYVVYAGTNTVCPNAPLTISASVNKPTYSVNSCEVSLDHSLASSGGSNSPSTTVSSMYAGDISTLNNEYFIGSPDPFDGGVDKETPAGYRPYPPVTDSLSYARSCRVEYSLGNFRNGQAVRTYTAVVPQASFSYSGSSLGTHQLSSTGSSATASVSATATSSGSISVSSSPQYLYLVAYMPADPSIIGEGGWYSYNIFTQQALQGGFGSTSTSLSIKVENRNPSIGIDSISPSELSSVPQVFTLSVRNTGNIPVTISSASASNGYGVTLLDTPTINPGSTSNVRVRVDSAGSGSFTITLTASPSASVDCAGNALADVSAGVSVEGPAFDTYPRFTEETQVPVEDEPVELNYNVEVVFENSGAENVPVHIEVTDRETGEVQTLDQLVSSPAAGAEKVSLPTMVCTPDRMKIYDINISVDPLNSIEETDESNNNLTTSVFCITELSCSPDPQGVLMMPGFATTSRIYCGLDITGELMPCDYSGSDLPIEQDEEFSRYIDDGLDARVSDTRPTLELEFFPTITAGIGASSYELNVRVENQDKTFSDIDGDPVSISDLTYTCPVQVTYLGGECSYYI